MSEGAEVRRTGFGVFYDYDDLPPSALRLSPDGERAAAFWIRRQRGDRSGEDTVYAIAVWDVATKEQVASYTYIHAVDHVTGEVDGEPLVGVHFAADGGLLLDLGDGSSEPAGVPEPDPISPWERRRANGNTEA